MPVQVTWLQREKQLRVYGYVVAGLYGLAAAILDTVLFSRLLHALSRGEPIKTIPVSTDCFFSPLVFLWTVLRSLFSIKKKQCLI